MAQIVINEISQNYTYNIGSNSFATVALPITSCWGPAYMDNTARIGETKWDGSAMAEGDTIDEMLEATKWEHFPATQAGLESFVAAYRGPSANFRMVEDYSYQMAMTLLTAGYDVLVCRVCPGTCAEFADYGYRTSPATPEDIPKLLIKAKYPGTFGNNLYVVLKYVVKFNKVTSKPTGNYWNLITYVEDSSGIRTAVENLMFVFDVENSTDSIPHIDEVESKFLTLTTTIKEDNPAFLATPEDNASATTSWSKAYKLTGGSDWMAQQDATTAMSTALKYATTRYTSTLKTTDGNVSLGAGYSESDYVDQLTNMTTPDTVKANAIMYREWLFNAAFCVYSLLQDKLNYNPQRIISPGWDDQDFKFLGVDEGKRISKVSPLHKIMMETAYYSRCAAGLIDIPKCALRATVYDDSTEDTKTGYAQLLSRTQGVVGGDDVNAILFNTHCGLYAPWGQYKYVGMGKQCIAPPSFLALMIMRAMILNQSLQYEWALPTNRKHNLNIGKMDYKVPKKLLDVWQKLEGVGVNVITEIPELGLSVWGNSTLYEVPPATYQALANMSTRYLVNAVKDVAYKCGLAITFQYNNEQAYNKFYAGVTPLLDTMKNVGAIDDYYVKMAADINGLDQVNANTVIGKIYLVINGVINDIIIDLIALPPGVDLNQYKS